MAIMSFAHLKNRIAPEKQVETPTASSRENTVVRKAPGKVMSFAHLKDRKSPAVAQDARVAPAEVKQPVAPRISRFPIVMETALLVSINYCTGCPRFLPASDWEKVRGNPYGRCLRGEDYDYESEEVWKVIPATAPVSRCYYHIKKN